MALIKNLVDRVAKAVGDDGITKYDVVQDYIPALSQACLFLSSVLPERMWEGLRTTNSVNMTDGNENVALPADYGRPLRLTRDGTLADFVEATLYDDLYLSGSSYFAPSTARPVFTVKQGAVYIRPAGTVSTEATVLTYVKTLPNNPGGTFPVAVEGHAAAVAYAAAILRGYEDQAEKGAVEKLQEAGIMLPQEA